MYENLRSFVQALERAGELTLLTSRVSPVLEITAHADRQSKSPAPSVASDGVRRTDPARCRMGGKALLFTNVEGSDFPVLINAYGSYRRVEMALGCCEEAGGRTPGGLEGLAERLGKLVKPEPPPTLLAKLQKIPELLELAKLPPKKVRSGPCQEVVLTGGEVDLTRLPLLRCWPHDGDLAAVGYPADVNAGVPGVASGEEWDRSFRGRYVTMAGIHTIHADDASHPAPPSRNIGMYRVQLMGKRHMAMHWHMHHDGARHWRSWKAKGQRMPVAIALGGESVLPYAATAPMPPGISELLLAGFLNRGAISLVDCKTVPLAVPANAEIVIEGYVSNEAGLPGWDPRDPSCGPLGPGAVFEGPFGDHTGFYSLPDRYPLLEVTAITHRKDAIYPTTVVGLPPQEDYFLGKATERLFLPLLRTIVPDIVDYDLPMFGAFHNCAFLKIKKEYPLHARRVMHAIWGAGQMSWTKTIVVVDHDVDVHDEEAVLRAVSDRCETGRDIERVRGPLDILDHAAPRLGSGTKIGLDATRKIAGEEIDGRPLVSSSSPVAGAEDLLARVRALPGVLGAALPAFGWLLVSIEKTHGGQAAELARLLFAALPPRGGPRYVVVVGGDVDVRDADAALFHWCAQCDAGRDAHERTSPDGSVSCLLFDATPKMKGDERHGQSVRAWPAILRMDGSVLARAAAATREP